MKLAIFDEYRLGVVVDDDTAIVDVSGSLPDHDTDPFGAGWWVRLCRDFTARREGLEQAAACGKRVPLASVRLRPAALNPSKVVATASNYAAHRAEMHGVLERVGQAPRDRNWMGGFGVFLKSPSSLIGPTDPVRLVAEHRETGREVHHESELAFVIGTGGSDIAVSEAMAHVLGYTIGVDMTIRGDGDRSYRKSFDTFTPLGPWLVTSDEIGDPAALRIHLEVGGHVRQDVCAGDMEASVAEIIAYASRAMTLCPGDVFLTGAPPGVGPVTVGDTMTTTITRIGTMTNPVEAR